MLCSRFRNPGIDQISDCLPEMAMARHAGARGSQSAEPVLMDSSVADVIPAIIPRSRIGEFDDFWQGNGPLVHNSCFEPLPLMTWYDMLAVVSTCTSILDAVDERVNAVTNVNWYHR